MRNSRAISSAGTGGVWFLGHGTPENALADNSFTKMLRELRALAPEPRAILVVSAHWYTEGTLVTAMSRPKTIHDFFGFPKELSSVDYPAPGDPELASEIVSGIECPRMQLDPGQWGLDHGTWSLLRHIYPEARWPVLQLSIDRTQPPEFHLELGRQLAALRKKGVLIVGSGNLVHNLRQISWKGNAPTEAWALEFDQWVKEKMDSRDEKALTRHFLDRAAGRMAVPSPDHYLPMLYALGASERTEIRTVFDEFQNANISMRSWVA